MRNLKNSKPGASRSDPIDVVTFGVKYSSEDCVLYKHNKIEKGCHFAAAILKYGFLRSYFITNAHLVS